MCTIGGNVAENSGGAHCLKYGFTSTHVLELLVVLADGETVRLDRDGALDLAGAFVGSEGTLGIATEVVVRVVPRPQRVETLLAAFPSTDAAGEVVSAIIGGGHRPGGRRDDGRSSRSRPPRTPSTRAFRATPAPSCSSSSTGRPWRSS